MSQCEMCGTKEASVRAELEGSILVVCPGCAKFGKVVGTIRLPVLAAKSSTTKTAAHAALPEVREEPIRNVGSVLKNYREKHGLTQKDFAKLVRERESVLSHYESGKLEPSLDTCRKLEHILHVKLVEKHTVEDVQLVKDTKKKTAGLTIGDMIKL